MKTNLSFIIALFSLLSSHFSLLAQSPDWVDFTQRRVNYPDDRYFTGHAQIGVEKNENPGEKLKSAGSYARSEATQSVQTTVRTMTDHNTLELNLKIYEEYRQSVSVFSDLTVEGMHVEPFYDKKHRMAQAFAWIKKSELLEASFKLYHVHAKQIESKIHEAEGFQSAGMNTRALDAFRSCLPLLRELQKDMILTIICGGDITGKLPSDFETQINSATVALEKTPVTNLEELCQRLGNTVKKQCAGNDRLILITPFTFEDSRMGSPLSGRLLALTEEIFSGLGLPVTTKAANNTAPLVMTGVYWETAQALTFTITVRELNSGKAIAGATGELPQSWFTGNGISWKPENFADALARQKMMSKDEITGGGLQLDVWTDKGTENLLFSENEIMKISVRANHECNLRLIYYLADGSGTLLDEFRIPSDQVNKVVTLPNGYRCSSPFGVEMLQVAAQNAPFTPLQFTEKGGYKMLNENTRSILSNVRGFVIDSDQKLFAEKRLTITTISK